MSSFPEETPDLDFTKIPLFRPASLADGVVWPAVDYLWRGNWREESQESDNFRYPKSGEYEDRQLTVMLEASCEMSYASDPENGSLCAAALYIEEEVEPENKDTILDMARSTVTDTAENEEFEEVALSMGEKDIWPEGNEEYFIVRNGIMYAFTTDGDYDKTNYRSIVGPKSTLSVPFAHSFTQENVGAYFGLPDLADFEAACDILVVPEFVVSALSDIQSRPIFSY